MAPKNHHDEDQEVLKLVAQACAGDHGAFEAIYRRYSGRVYGLCLRMCADVTAAEIATQDTFVRAWDKLETFSGTGSLGGWLNRLAAHAVADGRRRRRRRERLVEELPVPPVDSGGEGRDGARSAYAIDLERAIARLPAAARTVFVLHDIEGYRHREIAELTGTATGTSKAQLHRARKLLRVMLAR